MSRAENRHHAKRIREKYRQVATRWAGRYDSWYNRWIVTADGVIHHYIDRQGAVKRLRFIERTMNALAHHHKCPCGLCKRTRYNRRTDAPPIEFE